MTITDLPLFSMLRTRMQWHQERQRLLSENVANADTPSFRPRDLAPLEFGTRCSRRWPRSGSLAPHPAHIAGSGAIRGGFAAPGRHTTCAPAGNAVNLEDEMIKVAANQMDYQAATTLYTAASA